MYWDGHRLDCMTSALIACKLGFRFQNWVIALCCLVVLQDAHDNLQDKHVTLLKKLEACDKQPPASSLSLR